MKPLLLSLIPLSLAVFAPAALAGPCDVAIAGSDAMKFDLTEIKIPATCKKVTVTLTHTGKLQAKYMGHDWVLAKTADVEGIDADGLKAGLDAGYLKANDARVIAHTKVIGGGESATVTFSTGTLVKGGDYTFFCSFPGHSSMMKGKFVFG